jgi:hypothetical protein
MAALVSRDGTKLAYENVGTGPAVILVGGALNTRRDAMPVAELLEPAHPHQRLGMHVEVIRHRHTRHMVEGGLGIGQVVDGPGQPVYGTESSTESRTEIAGFRDLRP